MIAALPPSTKPPQKRGSHAASSSARTGPGLPFNKAPAEARESLRQLPSLIPGLLHLQQSPRRSEGVTMRPPQPVEPQARPSTKPPQKRGSHR